MGAKAKKAEREEREGSPPAAFMEGGGGTEEGERRVRETFVKNMI